MAALTAGLFLGPPCKKLRNLVYETAGSAASRVLGSQMSFRPLIHFMVGRPPAATLWHWDPNTIFSDLCQAALKSTIAPGLTKLSDNRRSPCWLPALEGQARWLRILCAPTCVASQRVMCRARSRHSQLHYASMLASIQSIWQIPGFAILH